MNENKLDDKVDHSINIYPYFVAGGIVCASLYNFLFSFFAAKLP